MMESHGGGRGGAAADHLADFVTASLLGEDYAAGGTG